jgi:hypothetical protein
VNVTSLLSAAAATLAAALAAINLYVLGRRERNRWLRETLIDEYSAYLNASFRATSTAKKYAELESQEADSEPRKTVDREVKDFHSQQMDILTRLRLLAPAEAVDAATEVHQADEAVVSLTV